jgi:type IV secretory pathway VirB10-like protein
MRGSKSLLVIAVLTGVMAVGCAHKQRIEGEEVPTQPQSNETIAPPAEAPAVEAPPPVTAEAPPPVAADTPTPEPTVAPEPPPPVAEEKPAANPLQKYIVVKGDTLWGISGMDIIYKDNFQWPLLFKENRDQIKDPDLIYPKQEFLIRHDFSLGDINKARKDASDTPKYVPHTQPRETLPVDYF